MLVVVSGGDKDWWYRRALDEDVIIVLFTLWVIKALLLPLLTKAQVESSNGIR